MTCSHLASLPAVLSWILVGILLIWQTARDRRALAVFAPLVVLYLLWSIVRQALPFDSSTLDRIGQGIGDVSAAVASIWLLLPHLRRERRLTTFLVSLLIALIVVSIPAAAESSTTHHLETISRILSAAVPMLAICASLFLAKSCSRHMELGRRFVIWLGAWLLAITFLGILATAAIFLLVEDGSLRFFFLEIGRISQAALVITAAVYLIVLPFLILAAGSPFQRRRIAEYLEISKPSPLPFDMPP